MTESLQLPGAPGYSQPSWPGRGEQGWSLSGPLASRHSLEQALAEQITAPRPASLRKTQLLPGATPNWRERETEERQAALFDVSEEDISWLNSEEEGEATVHLSALGKLRLMAGSATNARRAASNEHQSR